MKLREAGGVEVGTCRMIWRRSGISSAEWAGGRLSDKAEKDTKNIQQAVWKFFEEYSPTVKS